MPEAGHLNHVMPHFFPSKLPDTTALRMSTGNLSLATCHGFSLVLRISNTYHGTKLAAQTLSEEHFLLLHENNVERFCS